MTKPTISTQKFHPGLQSHPNFAAILAEANKSPHVVEMLNRFSGEVVMGKAGSGGFFSPGANEISVAENWVNNTSDPEYLKKFVTMLGHELGHAVEPGGYALTNSKISLDEYVDVKIRSEGVAILTEYKVAKDLGSGMWSGSGSDLKKNLDTAWEKHGGTHNKKFAEDAIKIGGDHYRTVKPSNTTHLNYEQYYSVWHTLQYGRGTLHNYTNAQIGGIDWHAITPGHFKIADVNGQKRAVFLKTLPFLPGTPMPAPAHDAPSSPSNSLASDAFAMKLMRQAFAHKEVSSQQPADVAQHGMATMAEFRGNRLQRATETFDEKLSIFMKANPELGTQMQEYAEKTGESMDAAMDHVLLSDGRLKAELPTDTKINAAPLLEARRDLEVAQQRHLNGPNIDRDNAPGL